MIVKCEGQHAAVASGLLISLAWSAISISQLDQWLSVPSLALLPAPKPTARVRLVEEMMERSSTGSMASFVVGSLSPTSK